MTTAGGPAGEARALAQVAERLRADYGLSAAQVDAAIAEALSAFAGRPVRDFVPILVERRIRERLGRSRVSSGGGPSSP